MQFANWQWLISKKTSSPCELPRLLLQIYASFNYHANCPIHTWNFDMTQTYKTTSNRYSNCQRNIADNRTTRNRYITQNIYKKKRTWIFQLFEQLEFVPYMIFSLSSHLKLHKAQKRITRFLSSAQGLVRRCSNCFSILYQLWPLQKIYIQITPSFQCLQIFEPLQK